MPILGVVVPIMGIRAAPALHLWAPTWFIQAASMFNQTVWSQVRAEQVDGKVVLVAFVRMA